MNFVTLVLASLLAIAPIASASTAFQLESSPQCSNGLEIEVDYLSCNGSNSCELGQNVLIHGSLTIPEGFSESVFMHSQACVFGWRNDLFCDDYDFEVNLCAVFDLYEQGCPEPGEYEINGGFVLPGQGGQNLGSSWWATVYTEITAEEASYECSTRIKAVSGSSSTAYFIGMSLVALVGVGSIFMRKRRTAAKIDLAAEEDASHFEMMGDMVRV